MYECESVCMCVSVSMYVFGGEREGGREGGRGRGVSKWITVRFRAC